MLFGKFFKECRLQCGYTQKYVADKLGIRQSNVSDWENDVSRPDYEKLIALSEMYEASLYDLFGIEDPMFRSHAKNKRQ